ncbi:MAG TPA: Hsp20/alpha crystallin family protein [bacterium]|nr:Hsp20/alpha crystallin family protein [bacterium]
MSWSRNGRRDDNPAGSQSPRVRVLWDTEEPTVEVKTLLPAMDIYEKDDAVVIEIELPGVKKENIEVYVAHNLVAVEGLKEDIGLVRPGSGGKRVSFLQLERKLGVFRREIELPITCNTREGKASYESGVLVIEFKKISDRRGERRRIPVS